MLSVFSFLLAVQTHSGKFDTMHQYIVVTVGRQHRIVDMKLKWDVNVFDFSTSRATDMVMRIYTCIETIGSTAKFNFEDHAAISQKNRGFCKQNRFRFAAGVFLLTDKHHLLWDEMLLWKSHRE